MPLIMDAPIVMCLSLALLFYGGNSATITFKNNCAFTIWPGTLAGAPYTQLNTTGFELATGATSSVFVTPPWSGRFFARTGCTIEDTGLFKCLTGDCASGQVGCNGAGAIPPATLIELFAAPNGGQDFYDVSNVDGFNLPMSIAPQGGNGDCKPSSCPANINTVCPNELKSIGPDGKAVACKSACTAFNKPEYCCSGEFSTPEKCPPTQYSKLFKTQCPDAYSYAYDDKSSTFTCSSSPNYAITFCP